MRWQWFVILATITAAHLPSDAVAQRFGGRPRAAGAGGAKGDKRSKPEQFPAAPKVPAAWVGMKIMPRTPTAPFGRQDKPAGHASDVSPWPQTVRKVSGNWLWIETPGAAGWISAQDVVPLADAILYFNGRIARQKNAWDLYMRGSALRDQERFDETYKDFKALEKLEEQEFAALTKRADAQNTKNDYHGLIATTTRMARLIPSNVTIYTSRGGAYLALNDIARAKADYDHAVELAASTETYAARATFYRLQGDVPRAIEDLDKAIYHWPLVRLYEERAKCLILQADYGRAIEDLNVALANDPQKVENYLLRGRANLASGHAYEGNVDFSTAIRLAPKAETYEQAATMRYLANDFRRAIDDATIAIRLNPRRPVAYLTRGDSYRRIGRYEDAMADFNRAIQLNPRDSQAFVQRGQVAFKLNNPEQALRDGVEAYRLGDRSMSCLVLTGLGYLSQGNAVRCIHLMDEALRVNPTFSKAYSLRSLAAWVTGNDDKARSDDIEARLCAAKDTTSGIELEVGTDIYTSPPIESRRSIFLTNFGMPERALAAATEVIARLPNQSGGYYARGVARARLQDYEGATQDLQAAIARNPTNTDAYKRLTECNLKQELHDPLVVNATSLLVLDGPSFLAFYGRAWGWHGLHEPERAIEDISDALTYRDDLEPERVAACYLLRSESYQRLGRQAERDADRQRAAELAHHLPGKWDELMRKADRNDGPSLFVHMADGENLRVGATKSEDSAKEKKEPAPWEEDFSFRLKDPGAEKKTRPGTPAAFR
jgi:tetratricopeptide (TPR) repeat protein